MLINKNCVTAKIFVEAGDESLNCWFHNITLTTGDGRMDENLVKVLDFRILPSYLLVLYLYLPAAYNNKYLYMKHC